MWIESRWKQNSIKCFDGLFLFASSFPQLSLSCSYCTNSLLEFEGLWTAFFAPLYLIVFQIKQWICASKKINAYCLYTIILLVYCITLKYCSIFNINYQNVALLLYPHLPVTASTVASTAHVTTSITTTAVIVTTTTCIVMNVELRPFICIIN